MFLELLRDFRGALVRSKMFAPSFFKVTTGNHSYVIRSSRFEVDAYKINNC